jgi:DNA-binding MarR family transcriptional regulator
VRSGSWDPASSVEPTRSAKRTVASFRSSLGSTDLESGFEQLGQNRAPAGTGWPQFGQYSTFRSVPRLTPNPGIAAGTPLSTLLSRVLVALTIELDNEFERRFTEAGGGARTASLVMWSNVLRFVGDGIAVSELPAATGLERPRVLSMLGGLERWRYVTVGPASKAKREGWGSGRGIRSDWIVRLTPAGRNAAGIWASLSGEIEGRWEKRFGADALAELRACLSTIVDRIDVELPEYVPIVGSADGMVAGLSPRGRQATSSASPLPLTALLSQVLLAYTLDFEQESELSLPLSANVVRVLDEKGELVRDLPRAAGVSKEAIAMALTFLARNEYVAVEGTTAATKRVRLTRNGREAQADQDRLHREVEKSWVKRFGADEIHRLRVSLQRVVEQRDALSRGLEPYPEGWRASKPYAERTAAMVADPSAMLPHYPMVLHRGGWPDGS